VKKALVIVNPTLGADTTGKLREELANHFPRAGIRYEVLETAPGVRTGDVVQARLRDGINLVVAAGGDGTVAAAIDGLVGNGVPLGIVPLGTGNLVARELGLPRETGDAVALIAGAPRPRRIDALRINGRSFVLNASVGISAAIMGDTTRGEKQFFGPMAYIGTGIWRVPGFKPQRMEVTIDGLTRTVTAMDVAVLNCGILTRTIYPKGADVRLDDGHLDVLFLRVGGLLDYPRYFLDLLLHRPATPLAFYIPAERKVVIRSLTPQAVQADGDIIGHTPVEIDVLPAAVTVLVPDTSPVGRG
jgi:YegS/Rv2252/BmrU family lipid kinase